MGICNTNTKQNSAIKITETIKTQPAILIKRHNVSNKTIYEGIIFSNQI
jgi:hypothetical protein